ncbi:MAG: phosphodiester glycosidase family protein [Phycisphaerae bacterium]|nr:phosphodiester glycosidase family protein [Phycisphaerae bacterium]
MTTQDYGSRAVRDRLPPRLPTDVEGVEAGPRGGSPRRDAVMGLRPLRRLGRTAFPIRLIVRLMIALLVPAPGCAKESPEGTASAPAASEPAVLEIVQDVRIAPWKPIFTGIELCQASAVTPRPQRIHAARIDLTAAGIRFLVTPSNGELPGEVNGRQSLKFLSEFKCQLAINASFFAGQFKVGAPLDIVGLSVSNGDVYSPANEFAALLISEDNRARVSAPPFDLAKVYNAAAGDTLLLKDGRIAVDASLRNSITVNRHPRSAAGVSRDGRYLLLMVIDGRQPGYSEGATKVETAEWLRKLGAWEAVNLDGGYSSNLVIEGSDGRPELLNHPGPAFLRPVANHIGVYARSLVSKN